MKYIKDLKIITVASADENHPRNSEASIIECENGALRVAWQRYESSVHGSNDNAPSTITVMDCESGNPDNGWTNPRVIAERTPDCVNVYSPDFTRLQDGSIMLMYMRYNQLTPGKPTLSTGYCRISHDDGKTFGEEKILWEKQGFRTCNDATRRLKSGRLINPIELAYGDLWTATDHRSISVMYSDDDGKSWEYSSNVIDLPMRGAMEPCIAECSDGSLIMVMRCQLGSVMRSYSYDGGISWSKPQTTGLKAPESCPYIMNIPNSDTLIVLWNNSEYDPKYASHYGKRTPLTAAFSDDNGKNFYGFTDIETDPNRAFTNPAFTWTKDGRCLLSYWTEEYFPNGAMGNPVDLRLATFRIGDK